MSAINERVSDATIDEILAGCIEGVEPTTHEIAMAIELQQYRAAAEPVAWQWFHLNQWHVTNDEERARELAWDGVKVVPLYRHAAPQVTSVPETLPCPVILEPGIRFGKGVRTQAVLDALQRRATYYAELESMTPEQRDEHDAGIKEFAAMLNAVPAVQAEQHDELPYDPQISEYEKIMQQAIPDGYALVPVEPTKEMIDAGWSYYMTTKSPSSLGIYGARPKATALKKSLTAVSRMAGRACLSLRIPRSASAPLSLITDLTGTALKPGEISYES